MKLTNALLSLLIAGCFLGVASSAVAATCSSTQGTAATGTVPGNSCGNNTNFSGSFALCGGVGFSSTGTDAWVVNLGASQDFTFSVTSSAFIPDIALVTTACADNSQCVNSTDYIGGNAFPSTATSGQVTGNAAGTYWLFITDSGGTGAQCGAYNLTLTGTLPVKLQDFSVQ